MIRQKLSGICIKGIAYELGEVEGDLAEVLEIPRPERIVMGADGVSHFRTTSRDPWDLAAASITSTLDESGTDPADIDVLLYATNTFWNPEFSSNRTTNRLLLKTGLSNAFAIGTHMGRCANIALALAQASALIASESADVVLVACADTLVDSESRVMFPAAAMRTDAAASMLVCRDTTQSDYAVIATAMGSDPSLETVTDDARLQRRQRLLNKTMEKLLISADIRQGSISTLIMNNYRRQIVNAYAQAAGFSAEQVFLDNIPRVGHALAADCLVNLKDFTIEHQPPVGSTVVLAVDGPSQWATTLLQR